MAHTTLAVHPPGALRDPFGALDDDFGAVPAVGDHAVADAERSDRVRRHAGPRSALEGIPVLIKDNVDTADLPTTAGSRARPVCRG